MYAKTKVYLLALFLSSLATSNALMKVFDDDPQDDTDVSKDLEDGCNMTCAQMTQHFQREWTSEFGKHYIEIVNIAVVVLRNNTRAQGKCKRNGPWCYYDSEVDRCTCCSGDCARGDLSCAVNCQGYLAYRNQSYMVEKLQIALNNSDQTHKKNLQAAEANHWSAVIGLVTFMVFILVIVILIGVAVNSNRDKILKNTKNPEGDRENLMSDAAQCSGPP